MHDLMLPRGDTSPTQAEMPQPGTGAGISSGGCRQLISCHGRLCACQHLPPLGKVFLLTSDFFFQSERPRNLRQTKTTKIPTKNPSKIP